MRKPKNQPEETTNKRDRITNPLNKKEHRFPLQLNAALLLEAALLLRCCFAAVLGASRSYLSSRQANVAEDQQRAARTALLLMDGPMPKAATAAVVRNCKTIIMRPYPLLVSIVGCSLVVLWFVLHVCHLVLLLSYLFRINLSMVCTSFISLTALLPI